MNEADDISDLILRVSETTVKATPPVPATSERTDQFFPKSENAFTEVPVFRHRTS